MTPETIKENPQEELQKILIELENYKRQLEILEKEDHLMDSTLLELNSTQRALEAVKKNKPGKEILVPLGSGSYIKGELKDTEKVLIGVGAGVSIEKTVEEAGKTLQEREKTLTKSREELQKKATELNDKILELNSQAEELIRKSREK